MDRSRCRCWLTVLALAIGLAACVPAHAAYDKLYRVTMPEGMEFDPETDYIRIVTNAMEIVTEQYDGWRNPWGDSVPYYNPVGGAYVTRLNFDEVRDQQLHPTTQVPWEWGDDIKVGVSVSDSDLRLRNLVWVLDSGDGEKVEVSVGADLGAVPGGGRLYYDEERGWIWEITNDHEEDYLFLEDVELGIFDEALPTDEGGLGAIVEEGGDIFSMRSAEIDAIICFLYGEVCISDLTRGQKWSLKLKLIRAAMDKCFGDRLYLRGRPRLARFAWRRAAQHMKTFASEVRRGGHGKGKGHGKGRGHGKGKRKGKGHPKPPELWAEMADEARVLLLALPGTEAAAAGEGGNGDGIPPGGSVEIVLGELPAGSAAVLHGQMTDEGGVVVVEWTEQVTIPDDLTPPTMLISPTPMPPEEPGMPELLVDPGTVVLWSNSPDVMAIHWGFPGDEGEEFPLNSAYADLEGEGGPPEVHIDFEGHGEDTFVCMAEDFEGNLSPVRTVVVDYGVEEFVNIDPILNCHDFWWSLGLQPAEMEAKAVALDLPAGAYLGTVTGGAMSLWGSDEENEGMSWLWGPVRIYTYDEADGYYELARLGLDYEGHPTYESAAAAALGMTTAFYLPADATVWLFVADEYIVDNRGELHLKLESMGMGPM